MSLATLLVQLAVNDYCPAKVFVSNDSLVGEGAASIYLAPPPPAAGGFSRLAIYDAPLVSLFFRVIPLLTVTLPSFSIA